MKMPTRSEEPKIIETVYNGYRFRSRLEARWAVFFEKCGFEYDYEPEGYKVGRKKYLPDFVLYNVERRLIWEKESDGRLFVEVKGNMDNDSKEKILSFSDKLPIYVVGSVPYGKDIFDWFSYVASKYLNTLFYNYLTIDCDNYTAMLCVNKQGNPEIVGADHDLNNIDVGKTLTAYAKARQARFEHGECG